MIQAATTLCRTVSRPNWAADHPEWWAVAFSGAAWVVMLAHGQALHGWMLCASPPLNFGQGFVDNVRGAWRSGALSGPLFGWGLMTVAMMPPLAIPRIRHGASRSFAARRDRAIAAFLAGMLARWLLVGLVALPALASVPAILFGVPKVVAAGLLIAAAWQLAPIKRAALARCHRTIPLSAVGWRADRDCFRFGLTYGLNCLASCWALMLVMALASHGPLVSLCGQFVALTERRARRPRFAVSAMALAACAPFFLIGLPLLPP